MGIPNMAGVALAPARNDRYVGADRRSRPARAGASQPALVTILALLFSLWGVLELGRVTGGGIPELVDAASLTRLLQAATVALGAVVGLLAFVQWRLVGEARALWLGAGALVMGPIAAGLGSLVPALIGGPDDAGVLELRLAGRAAAVIALIAASRWPQVDSRLRPLPMLGLGVLVVGTVTAVLFAPAAGTVTTSWVTWIVLAGAWLCASGLHLRAARTGDAVVHETIAVAAIAFALAELLMSHASGGGDVWAPMAGAALLHVTGFTLLVGRGLRDLEEAFVTQRARLLETEIGMEAEAARRRAQDHAREERAHNAKNSLLAIEGAAVTLERYRDRLAPERRAQLVEAVSGEIARLQKLIAAERREASEPFGVADLLGPVVAAEQARGLVVELEIPEDLTAIGSPAETVEVVRNLLDNARRYAPGSPVTVVGDVDGDWAVIHVQDRGRGIQREEREEIFERGLRGAAAAGTEGSGLGLFVSRRLMVDQGGDVWVESRPGGGASFGVCLPLGTPQPAEPVEDATSSRESIRRGA